MLLRDADGPDRLQIRVTGYQFPDVLDLRKRYSWHMIGGEAHCREGSWQFHWQALTSHESPQVSAWLTEVAESMTQRRALPEPLRFLEPNLTFSALPQDADTVRIMVGLDLEFQPPWHQRQAAGDPFELSFVTGQEQLRQAAEQWDAERSLFPGYTALGAIPDSAPWRAITASEAVLLAAAVDGDWEGAEELRSQLPGLLARSGCSCGCGSIELRPRQGRAARTASGPTPREGTVLDETGEVVGGLLLFLRNGFLQSLEVFSYGAPLPMPAPDRVGWEIADDDIDPV